MFTLYLFTGWYQPRTSFQKSVNQTQIQVFGYWFGSNKLMVVNGCISVKGWATSFFTYSITCDIFTKIVSGFFGECFRTYKGPQEFLDGMGVFPVIMRNGNRKR